IKSGKMKDIGSMTRPMTDDERKLLQGIIDNAYGQFVAAVAEGRHLPEAKVRGLADGRIFTGEQALKLGLVDELGDSYAAVQLAGKLGHIPGKPEVLRDGETISGLLQLIDSRLSFDRGPESLLGPLGALAPSGLEYRWRP
ncbi:MAG: S49 family peptidase, partial [Elusimicrobia bacterium]|nr:S49 family peptidase [Elusimicrobiota bacterium]